MTTPTGPTSVDLPMRFDGRDFARATSDDLLRAQARQVLLTEPGELPWRTDFGAGLDVLRHRRLDAVLVELARVDVRNAFRRWLATVDVAELDAEADGEALLLRLTLARRSGGQTTTVEITS